MRPLRVNETILEAARRMARAVSKVFYTYVERATLLGVLYALVPEGQRVDPLFISAWSEWSWQYALALCGSIVLVIPMVVEIAAVTGTALNGVRSPTEMMVRGGVGLAIMAAAMAVISFVVVGVAELLADLAH